MAPMLLLLLALIVLVAEGAEGFGLWISRPLQFGCKGDRMVHVLLI